MNGPSVISESLTGKTVNLTVSFGPSARFRTLAPIFNLKIFLSFSAVMSLLNSLSFLKSFHSALFGLRSSSRGLGTFLLHFSSHFWAGFFPFPSFFLLPVFSSRSTPQGFSPTSQPATSLHLARSSTQPSRVPRHGTIFGGHPFQPLNLAQLLKSLAQFSPPGQGISPDLHVVVAFLSLHTSA